MNKFLTEDKVSIDVLDIDNNKVRIAQTERLKEIRKKRNNEKVKQALKAITEGAKSDDANILELAVEAARLRATLGEISDALEEVFGRYKANIQSISGVYSQEAMENNDFIIACKKADEYADLIGRRPRIMVAKMGQDGHDRGAKVISTSFADIGFDVDIGSLFQTPQEAVKQAIENDVHIIGVSSLAAGHKTLVPQVIDELKK